jgi:hypothetical protein
MPYDPITLLIYVVIAIVLIVVLVYVVTHLLFIVGGIQLALSNHENAAQLVITTPATPTTLLLSH